MTKPPHLNEQPLNLGRPPVKQTKKPRYRH